MEDFKKLFDSFSSLKVGVIGDLMLDTYMWGRVDRISPEAPVPVVSLQKKDYRIGGAGNVALNCQSLGAAVSILSVTGNDAESSILEQLLTEKNIDSSYLVSSSERITTNKTRIISRNQQMLRLDNEITTDISKEEESTLIEKFRLYLNNISPDVIILEDYNKGVLTENVIQAVISECKSKNIVTAVDPKRKNFFAYKNADIFKPNLKEVKEGLNIITNNIDDALLADIHRQLEKHLQHTVSFITLSEKGVFYNDNKVARLIPSHFRNITDVSGAGDTVIAVAAMVYGVTRNVHLMSEVANIAGGLVCEEVGTVAINKDKLLHECELLLS
jgi:rfaE bifunctional protein kinase chain/domain